VIASGIVFERETEGRRITPPWWIHNAGARSWTEIVLDGTKRLINAVEHSIVERAESTDLAAEPESWALLILRGLELGRKMPGGMAAIHYVLNNLRTLRNANAD